MKNNWKKVRLGDFVNFVNDKIEIEKINLDNYISTENLLPNKAGVVGAATLPNISKVNHFLKGDIIFSNIRTYFKKVWFSGFEGGASNDVLIFRPSNTDILDKNFLYYVISNDDFINHTVVSSKGTKMPRGDKDAMKDFEFLLPSIGDQKKIAAILSAYDDLIENNNRRIKVLEEMAQRIYQEWFVDFRFPGHEKVKMIEGELGLMPEGWEVKIFGEVFDIRYGKTLPKTKIGSSGNFPVYGAGSVIGYYDESNLEDRVALVTCRGNGSGTVWRTREAAFVTNNSFTVRCRNGYSYFNFSLIYLLLLNSDLSTSISGSAQPQITIEGINTIKIMIPNEDVARKFQIISDKIFDEIDSFYFINKNLRQTRELLLPKLMDGEIEL